MAGLASAKAPGHERQGQAPAKREVVGARHLDVLPLSKGLRQLWALSKDQVALPTNYERRDRDGRGFCRCQGRIACLCKCPQGLQIAIRCSNKVPVR